MNTRIFKLITAIISVLFITTIVSAQDTKTMYIMKNGKVIFQSAVSEIDSIIFYNPADLVDPYDDNKLLELAYDKSYKYPAGFYHEKNLTGSRYYENTVSTKPTRDRKSIWIELHTTDKEEAKNWSNLSNEYSSVNRILTRENETDKYFEFVRVNEVRDTDILLSRVHRSDYFIPLFDRFAKTETIGIYNGNISLSKVKECVEYLLDCGTLSIIDKVVESKISEKGNKYEHYIQTLRIVYGDWGLYDMIYIYDNTFEFDKETKILKLVEQKLVKEIKGNYNELTITD